MVFVPALATEVDGVQPFVRVPRQKLLSLHGDSPLARRIEGAIRMLCAGKELVELEGEEAFRIPPVVSRPFLLRGARHEEKFAESLSARRRRPLGRFA